MGVTNIYSADYEIGEATTRQEPAFRYLDLSGEHIGVRVEETPVGGTTSRAHYIENTSEDVFKYLVFGERIDDDQVFYS